jgi:hypothetical protein
MKRHLLFVAVLAACTQEPSGPAPNQGADSAPGSASPAAARPFAVEEKTELYEFAFGWPAEAAAIPELAARFQAEMAKAKDELAGSAEAARAMRARDGGDVQPFTSSTSYETVGQSQRLLSLAVEVWEYTGGAHGNGGTGALLWDRAARKEIQTGDMFADPANRDRLLTQRWCDALTRAREEKRGEPVGGGGMFDDCPKLDDIAILPADKDMNGRFDTLLLVASPYVAGPYVEGSYEIGLSVTPDLIATLRRDYQPSFEAGIEP